ncbi:NAD(P)-dependent dehydrogenase (short-subunit alcohol dehydrogenase family) [Chryseobacterium ginsenosidimutans]|nr:NAD(P)-dependent dehydrogenase (short-subunit alcohol dehydrogenase family) [Chryseobacterium ginsenosidimutans]
MNLNLDHKIIIVSGGAKGIGNAIAKILAEEKAFPIIIGRNEDDNKKAIQEIVDKGGKADFVTAELSQPEECKKAIEEVVKKYGKIDGIVNNAGVNDGIGLENGSYEGFLESYHKNVVHYYLLVHHALPYLKESKGFHREYWQQNSRNRTRRNFRICRCERGKKCFNKRMGGRTFALQHSCKRDYRCRSLDSALQIVDFYF